MLFSVSVNSIFSYLHLSLFTLSANIAAIRQCTVSVVLNGSSKNQSSVIIYKLVLFCITFFCHETGWSCWFFQAITGNKDLGFQASWRQNIAACKKYKCSFCWIFQALRSNDNLNPLCEEQTIIQMCVTDNISFQWAVFRCKQII